MAATLTVGSVFGVYVGYYAGFAGSLSPELSPGGTTNILVTGLNANRISWSISGNQVAALAGLTHLKVNGTNIPLVFGPTYDAGSNGTDVEFGPYAGFTIGNSYPLELVGVGGGGPAGTGKVKVWTGLAWVEKPVKAWTGSAWAEKPLKVRGASSWDLA